MGENSKIEWTTHTFNPWMGCTKVSAGCTHCYAENQMDHRYGKVVWGKGNPRQRTTPANWRKPIAWNKAAKGTTERPRVFCASLADVFDSEAAQEWRDDLWRLIESTPNLDWLLLTKRPENVLAMVPETWREKFPPHIWVGTSVENQEAADKRIPYLVEIPAVVRFLSCEPLLGPVDLFLDHDEHHDPKDPEYSGYAETSSGYLHGRDCRGWCDYACNGGFYEGEKPIHWVIVGGESGPGARPMSPLWAKSLRDQCQAAGVAYLFKQWGEWVPWIPVEGNPHKREVQHVRHDGKPYKAGDYSSGLHSVIRVGKHNAGRELDGRTWNEFPVVAQAVTSDPHL